MGACDFETFGFGKDLQSAYVSACQTAEYESGHDPYNGTISTTDSVTLADDAPKYGTKAFARWLDKKWEHGMLKRDCYAVPITGVELKRFRKRHRLERRKIKAYYFFGLAAC